ncbi:ankyrin repeat domain-containing protein [Paramyrothecium foliicola]|nr:ankyrin repeat domain-containing protein [Paramyrothecium foliicola]
MAEIIANAIGIITGTINTIHSVYKIVEKIKDAPQETRHLHGICKLVHANLETICTNLKQRAENTALSQTEQLYYDAICQVVLSMNRDLISIQSNLPSLDETKPRTKRFRLLGSRTATAIQLEVKINREAIERIKRSITILHWTTTNLWQYEQATPVAFDQNFQNRLREFLHRLSGDETEYQAKNTSLLPAPDWEGRIDSLDVLRQCAFGIANNVAMRNLSSGRNTPIETIHSPSPGESGTPIEGQREEIHPVELGYQYSAALSLMRYANEQQFPDAAAEFGQEAVDIQRRLSGSNGRTSPSLEQFRLECEHVTLLLSCLNRHSRESGQLILGRLASDIDKLAASQQPANFDLKVAREELGNIYYDLSDWDRAIRYLRAALLRDNLSINDHDETTILRLSRKICKAYEASMRLTHLTAFRRIIADITGIDPWSDPPSFQAALNWCRRKAFFVDTVDQLPSFIGVRDQRGDSPLHRAICDQEVSSDVLRQLCQDSEALNAQGSNGLTPLFTAVDRSNIGAVTILLQEGASLEIRKPEVDFSDTVLHCCKDSRIMQILLDKLYTRRQSSATSDQGESQRHSISSAITIDARNSLGNTALLDACARNNYPMVKVLLERGADPNAPNRSGETSLIAVCYNEGNKNHKRQIVAELIACGADPAANDEFGRRAHDGLRQRGFSRSDREAMLSPMNQGGSLNYASATSGSTSISSLRVRSTDSGS